MTTATIHETDRQKLFDAMLGHIRQQAKPATARQGGVDKCLYRTDDGLKCAIGALIPDELYQPGFENAATAEVLDALFVHDPALRDFLTHAQNRLHDNPASAALMVGEYAFSKMVEDNARHLALHYGLTYTKPGLV
jgi:hypothetical protein